MDDRFLWWEAESYSFIKLPKILLESPNYATLSGEARILYSLLLDRMKLSTKNNWRDENGYVYIYYTQDEACKVFSCGHDKAGKIFVELEKANLIFRQRQGLGKPYRLYVLKFYSPDIGKSEVLTSENQESGLRKIRSPDCDISDAINTEDINTEMIKINPSISGYDPTDTEQRIKEQIEYDVLVQRCDKEQLDSIVMLMTDTVCGNASTVRIGGNEISREAVRSRLFKLEAEHIEYVIDRLKENTTKVYNPRAYMLTTLFNAPVSMDYYYTAAVNHDLYGT